MRGKRKVRKIEREDDLDAAQLEWKKSYAVFLKAADFSYGYMSDILGVTRSIVKHWFEDPQMRVRVTEIQSDITEGAIKHLKRAQLELIELLLQMARNESDAAVRLRAIESGLDRTGLSKVNKSESKLTKEEKETHEFSPEFFERLEGLPLETQHKLAEMATEMESMIRESKGAG